MIPLDIFRRNMHNKTITTAFEAWLTFLSEDDPEKVIQLIEQYPEFKPMYETLYQMCQNTERVMELFSEELRILDRNTVKYMIEQQQQELDQQAEIIGQQKQELIQMDEQLNQKNEQLNQKDEQLNQKDEQLNQKNEQLNQKDEQLKKLAKEMEELRRQLGQVNRK